MFKKRKFRKYLGTVRLYHNPFSSGPSSSDMEKQLAAKIAATTAYLNKEREETKKRKETIEEERKKTKEKLVERESSMEDFKRLQALRREAEGKR